MINSIFSSMGLLFPKKEILERLDVDSSQDFMFNKLPKMLDYMSEVYIHYSYLENVKGRLSELNRPPTVADIVRLADPRPNYENIFLNCFTHADALNKKDTSKKYDKYLYNIYLNLIQKYNINILTTKYENCKIEFINSCKIVDFILKSGGDLQQIPVIEKQQACVKDYELAKIYINEIYQDIDKNRLLDSHLINALSVFNKNLQVDDFLKNIWVKILTCLKRCLDIENHKFNYLHKFLMIEIKDKNLILFTENLGKVNKLFNGAFYNELKPKELINDILKEYNLTLMIKQYI